MCCPGDWRGGWHCSAAPQLPAQPPLVWRGPGSGQAGAGGSSRGGPSLEPPPDTVGAVRPAPAGRQPGLGRGLQRPAWGAGAGAPGAASAGSVPRAGRPGSAPPPQAGDAPAAAGGRHWCTPAPGSSWEAQSCTAPRGQCSPLPTGSGPWSRGLCPQALRRWASVPGAGDRHTAGRARPGGQWAATRGSRCHRAGRPRARGFPGSSSRRPPSAHPVGRQCGWGAGPLPGLGPGRHRAAPAGPVGAQGSPSRRCCCRQCC